MSTVLLVIFVGAVCFGAGYFVALHPDDTRSFFDHVRTGIGRLIHRGKE